uniref:START domain-containing protein n=1 Tax=Solanum lycopersicum TaxID=4081 RepID=A0A3Q7I3X9_SOLLC
MNLFPTIVTKAKTIEVLDSGTWGGSMQLMYEKLHILSPLVEAREFFFIRGCRQLDATTWIMVDISYDIFNDIHSGVPSYSWKFPSGCAIQDMGNGQSKEMLVLEETSINEMGAFLVYAPIDLRVINSIVNGGDATKVPILPSGIIISPDGRLSSNRDNTANAQNDSILIVTFQIMICGNNNLTSREQKMKVVGSVHGVLSATILRIKEALGCSYF